MNAKITTKNTASLYRVLEKNLQVLVAAGADETLIAQYSILLAFLRRHGVEGLERRTAANKLSPLRKTFARRAPNDLSAVPLDELLVLVGEEDLPRKDLERIAVDRFGVPVGSMRSFSNRRMLVDKLRTLIRNEQAHATIGDLARHSSRTGN